MVCNSVQERVGNERGPTPHVNSFLVTADDRVDGLTVCRRLVHGGIFGHSNDIGGVDVFPEVVWLHGHLTIYKKVASA